MLLIQKHTEFDENNSPVRGQCAPHAQGWQLVLMQDGQKFLLYEDTYYVCRQLQRECSGLDLPAAKAKVAQAIELLSSSEMQDTVKMKLDEERSD